MASVTALRAFVRLSRLKFLIGGFLGFGLGAAVAHFDGFPIGVASYAAGQIMVTAFHIMVHFANDYYDRFCDVSSPRTPWSGGSGVLVDGGFDPRIAFFAALVSAAIGTGIAVGFAAEGRIVVAAIGFAIGILAWSYSAPPIRLLARGWGELDSAIIVAILFPLAGYATFAGMPSLRALVSTLPAAAAMLVLMLCVEYPDVDADRASGKLNLVARAGRGRARVFIYAALGGAYVGTAIAIVFGAASTLAIFSALTIPLAWGLVEQLAAGEFADEPANADLAARGVAFFVATILGSTLAYVSVL